MRTVPPSPRSRRRAPSMIAAVVASVAFATSAVAQPAPDWRKAPPKDTPAPPKPAPPKDPDPPKPPDKPPPMSEQPMDMSVLPPVTNDHPTEKEISDAKMVFEAGGKEFDKGHYLLAIQAFEQAYGVAQRDGIIYSLANAHKQQFLALGEQVHLYKAIQLYRIFLARGKTGSRKGEATKSLGELEAIANARAAQATPPVMSPTEKPKTTLAIDSPTPDVLISVDGGEPEPPQVSMETTATDHTVVLTAPGFIDKTVTMHAKEGQLTAATFELEEKPAHLEVDVPSGAEISVDGRFVGKAPLASPLDLPSGKRFVSITLAGHKSQGSLVDLGRGEQKKLSLTAPSTGQRDASYGLFIAGGTILVGSAILAGFAFVKQEEASNLFELPQLTSKQADDYNNATKERDQYRAAAVVSGGLAGLLGAIGVGLFVFDRPSPVQAPADMSGAPKKTEPKKSKMDEALLVLPAFGEDFGGVTVRGAF
ncbi:MAG: PEGA domain-containing protein [Polyangiaceae bacterium]